MMEIQVQPLGKEIVVEFACLRFFLELAEQLLLFAFHGRIHFVKGYLGHMVPTPSIVNSTGI